MFRLTGIMLLAVLTAACSGERGLRCEESTRYESSTTAPPIRVPDDLDPPDESEALVIPQVPETELATASGEDEGECLETPPDFFGDDAAG